jgi:hypothetical protein
MGCHTWFYKKIESPSDGEIRNLTLERCDKEIDFLERLINNRESIDSDLLEAYPDWTPEWAKGTKSFWLEIKESIENNTIELDELYDHYCDWVGGLTEYIDGKGWFVECEYHDVFRKYGYPEDRLFSLQETLDYINNPNNKCVVYDDTNRRLEEFWNKYPDGFIEFG